MLTMNKSEIELLGDNHISTNTDTPLRKDAFDKSDEEKIHNIQYHFTQIMEELGLDLTDDSLSGTPYRVAKMYVNEIFNGLNPKNKPKASTFDNKYQYGEVLVEKNITLYSTCEHHFLPIVGKAHIAYIPGDKVLGLSKLNRITQYFAQRPQVQERLTQQIAHALAHITESEDVMVVVDAGHTCVSQRGIKDTNSTTVTACCMGKFGEKKSELRQEVMNNINRG